MYMYYNERYIKIIVKYELFCGNYAIIIKKQWPKFEENLWIFLVEMKQFV